MKRNDWNFFIDFTSFLDLLFLLLTGLIIHWVLPPGSGMRRTFLMLNRHEWGDIHFWLSMLFLLLMATHIYLHRKFIWHQIMKRWSRLN